MNITPSKIYVNDNTSVSFLDINGNIIVNLQNLDGCKSLNGQLIFSGDGISISFYIYSLAEIASSSFTLTYDLLDPRVYEPTSYFNKLNAVYADISHYVLVNKNGVISYPSASYFPATGQLGVIYIDQSTHTAYIWTDTPGYESISGGGGGSVAWGSITGTLSAQTDLQAALDAKFDDPTGTTSEYIRGDGSLATFPSIPGGTVTAVTATSPLASSGGTTPDISIPVSSAKANGYLSSTDWIAFNNKFNTPSGTTLQYVRGDGSLATFPTIPSITGLVPYTGATSDVDLGTYNLKADALELSQTPTDAAGVAKMVWNDTDGTIEFKLKGGNVTLQIGQEQVTRVVNKTGANLLEADYYVVYVYGAQGQRLAVKNAKADSDATSAGTLGMVTENISNNQEGFITTSGLVHDIDTTGGKQGETWADGDILYLSPTTAGYVTNVKPVAPYHTVTIGYCVYAHAVHGIIYVKVDNGYELGELHDVDTTISKTTPVDADNLLLQDSADSNIWKKLSWANLKATAKTYFDTLYQGTLTLTTTGTSGAATLVGSTLNIPQYGGGGGGGTIYKLTAQTLTAASWTLSGSYYTYTFSNVNITTNTRVDFTPDNSAYNEVTTCGMLPEVDVSSGSCTFYSLFPPQNDILGEVTIFPTV